MLRQLSWAIWRQLQDEDSDWSLVKAEYEVSAQTDVWLQSERDPWRRWKDIRLDTRWATEWEYVLRKHDHHWRDYLEEIPNYDWPWRPSISLHERQRWSERGFKWKPKKSVQSDGQGIFTKSCQAAYECTSVRQPCFLWEFGRSDSPSSPIDSEKRSDYNSGRCLH